MSGDREDPGPPGRLRAPERRAEAEHAIEQALATIEGAAHEGATPSVDQLSDLADAIDSFKEGSFGVAAELAHGALRRKPLPTARRPQSLARSIPDLRAAFNATRRHLAGSRIKHRG